MFFFVLSRAWDKVPTRNRTFRIRPSDSSEHRSAESEGLRFDSSWGLGIFFSLSHARDKMKKNIFSTFHLFVQRQCIQVFKIIRNVLPKIYRLKLKHLSNDVGSRIEFPEILRRKRLRFLRAF